jgi:hypothetical protein
MVLRATVRLLVVFAVLAAIIPHASADTITLTINGAQWNDGGSLSGYFEVSYTGVDGSGYPTGMTLVSTDITTGNGTNGDGFLGQTYIYDVANQTTNVTFEDIDATQDGGAPANEVDLINNNGADIFLDWQGTDPSTLYVGVVGGQYSSESEGDAGTRYINSQAGGVGSPSSVPEPSTFLLSALGLGMAGLAATRRVAAAGDPTDRNNLFARPRTLAD